MANYLEESIPNLEDSSYDDGQRSNDYEEYVLLRRGKKRTWTSVLFDIIRTQHEDAWKIVVCFCILVTVFIKSYYICFVRENMNMTFFTITAMCDVVYLIDYLMALWGRLHKKAQMYLMKPPRSKLRLLIDFLGLNLPIYFVNGFYEYLPKPNAILSLGYFIRYIDVIIFFREKLGSAGVAHGKYFLIQYLVNTFLLHHGLACIYAIYKTDGVTSATPSGFIPADRYHYYLYNYMVTATTAGVGEMAAHNYTEATIDVIAMLLGFCLTTGIYIGPLTSELALRMKRRALLRMQISNIKSYLKRIHVDKTRIDEINEYYKILWREKNGVQFANDLNVLPFPLRTEICFDINILPLLGSFVFKKTPEPFLRALAYRMKHEFYQPKDIVFHRGVVKNKMIFVVLGVVELLSDEDDQSPVIAFRAGSCLGEASLVVTLPSKASVRAACYTELQVLEREDFLSLLELYPKIYRQIIDDIFKRIHEAHREKRRQKAIKQDFTFSLFVSQYETRTPIKQLKDRLLGINKDQDYYDKYLPLYRVTSNTRNRTRNMLCLKDSWPWILHPNSSLILTWEIVVVITAVFSGYVFPYYITFVRSFPRWLIFISHFIDMIYVVDLYVLLTTAVVKDKRMVKTVKEIFDIRLQTVGFYIDLLCALQLEQFSYGASPENRDRAYQLFHLHKVLKCYRLPKLFVKMENNITWPILPLIFTKFIIYYVGIPFWVGAIFYIVNCFTVICLRPSWFYNLLRKAVDTVIEYSRVEDSKASISYYFGLTSFTTVGFGDIIPLTDVDHLIGYVVTVSGVLLFGYYAAQLSAVVTHRMKSRKDFQASFFSVKSFIMDKKISQYIRQRVVDFFVLQWYYDKGLGLEKKSLFYNASTTIQREVLVKERMAVILRIPMFQGTNLDFVQLIVMGAVPLILPPNEHITYHGVVIPEFYIIQEGYCKRFVETADNSRYEVKLLGPNQHFGVISMLNNIACIGSVVTLTHVKLLSITDQVFWSACSMFPQVRKEIEESMKEVFSAESLANAFRLQVFHDIAKKGLSFQTLKANRQVKFRGYLINVYKYCKERNEDYFEPFRKLRYCRWVRFLLAPYCILPDGILIKVWVVFRLTIALFVAILMPYQLIQAPYTEVLDRVLIWTDFVAYLDLYILLLVGYHGKKQQLIVHPLRTANHYLRGKFPIDLMLCFPYEVVVKLLMPAHNEGHSARSHILSPHNLHCVFRSFRILQIYKLPQAFDYLKTNIKLQMGHWAEIFKFAILTMVIVNLWTFLLFKTSCGYVARQDLEPYQISIDAEGVAHLNIPHINAAVLSEYTMACEEDCWFDRSKFSLETGAFTIYIIAYYFGMSIITAVGMGDITAQHLDELYMAMFLLIFGVIFFGSKFSWETDALSIYIIAYYFAMSVFTAVGMGDITAQHLDKLYMAVFLIIFGVIFFGSKFSSETNAFGVYIIAYYFGMSVITAVGMGDLTPQQLYETYMTLCLITFGVIFFGYVYACISSQKTTTHSAIAKQQEMMKELSRCMKGHKVSRQLQKKICDYLEYRWKRTKGADPQEILSNLHTALHEDAVLDIYENVFREVPLLEGSTRSFLGKLGKEVKERYYLRGQVIFRAEDIIDNLFIMLRGKVEIVSHYNDMVAYMGAGGIFGNITLDLRHKINVTIVALSNVDVLFIRNEAFRALLKKYPALRRTVETTLAQKLDYIVPTTMMFEEEDDEEDDDFKKLVADHSGESVSTGSRMSRSSRSSTVSRSVSTAASISRPLEYQEWYGLVLLFIPTKWCRVAILPECPLFTIMNLTCMVLAYVNFFIATYQFCFQAPCPIELFIFLVVLDLCFFFKNFLELHKAYENRYGDYITDNKKIAKRFFENKKKRFIELLANLPLCYLAYIVPSHKAILVFSSMRLLTLPRTMYIYDFYKDKYDRLMINRCLLELSSIALAMSLVLHSVACIWYFIACPLGECKETQWLDFYDTELKLEPKIRIYQVCIYFATSLFSATGIGDVLPCNNLEFIFVTIGMLTAKFLIGVFIADVMNVFAAASTALNNYEYGIKELKDYLQNGNLSSYQMEKMWEYLTRFWTRSAGKQVPRLVEHLHYTCRCDLYNEIYGPNLRNSYLFAGTEEAFIRQLVENVEHTVFFPGNYIVQHGDSDMSMYFIHTGEIDILTVHANLTETVHEVLVAGNMFGLGQGLFQGLPHYFSFRAKTTVDVIRLCLPHWEHLMEYFPKSKELIYKRAYEVYKIV